MISPGAFWHTETKCVRSLAVFTVLAVWTISLQCLHFAWVFPAPLVSRSNSARTSRLGRFRGMIRFCCAWSLPLSPAASSSGMTVTSVSWPEVAGTWAPSPLARLLLPVFSAPERLVKLHEVLISREISGLDTSKPKQKAFEKPSGILQEPKNRCSLLCWLDLRYCFLESVVPYKIN